MMIIIMQRKFCWWKLKEKKSYIFFPWCLWFIVFYFLPYYPFPVCFYGWILHSFTWLTFIPGGAKESDKHESKPAPSPGHSDLQTCPHPCFWPNCPWLRPEAEGSWISASFHPSSVTQNQNLQHDKYNFFIIFFFFYHYAMRRLLGPDFCEIQSAFYFFLPFLIKKRDEILKKKDQHELKETCAPVEQLWKKRNISLNYFFHFFFLFL